MELQKNFSWLYYKVCVGSRGDAINWLLLNHVAPLTKDPRVIQWFFIRYSDEDGPHLRMRFKVSSIVEKIFDREVYQLLHDATTSLVSLAPQSIDPLVRLRGVDLFAHGKHSAVRAKRGQYVQESEIYGVSPGIEIAEQFFQESSEIALDILFADKEKTISRKTLAPIMMEIALKAFPTKEPRSEFLERYANYWLSGAAEFGHSRAIFQDKAIELIEGGLSILSDADQLTFASRNILKRWEDSLSNSHALYRRRPVIFTNPSKERIAFYFIHLMNNRLGFSSMEEAYLAILLQNSERKNYV